MGAIGGLLGTSGGINGTGIAGPSGAPINPGTNAQQIAGNYNANQTGLQSQQALLQALQSQGGLNNQNQVYGQLQGVANGTGPNPAQAQLAQATGSNVANQAALMAGQRGAGANSGLMARQIAQQGAATQQNAAGQAATLQAQQSLNALNSAGNMANTQAANQIGATTANTGALQNEQSILQGANSAANNANVSMQGNINAVQGQLANTTMQGQQAMIGGAMQGIGQAMTLPSMGAKGGEVKKFADGGPTYGLGVEGIDPPAQPTYGLGVEGVSQPQAAPSYNLGVNTDLSGPQSGVGQYQQQQAASSQSSTPSAPVPGFSSDPGASALAAGASSIIGSGSKSVGNLMKDGSSAMSSMGGSGGGSGLMALAALAGGGRVTNAGSKLKSGGHVPGKAKVSGNSYKNDTVKALLSPGEVVIPRNVMQSGDPVSGAARFVQAVLAKKKGGK